MEKYLLIMATKKTRTFLMAAAVAFSATAAAQNASDSKSFADRLLLGFNVGTGTPSKHVTPVNVAAQVGYRFIPDMYAFVTVEGGSSLYHKDNVKTWGSTNGLGGGLGYTFYRDGALNLSAEASAMGTVGSPDFKQTTFDVRCVMQYHMGSLSLGYRHSSSNTTGLPDYNGMYATIGWRL